MHHLILGYGYSGYYLAQELLRHQQQVTAVSRHLNQQYHLPNLNHRAHDLTQPLIWEEPETIIYYLVPPSAEGNQDLILKQFLRDSTINVKKIIYFGSSGVYGNHQGTWVDEDSSCLIDHPRQLRRLDAEQQWMQYCERHHIDLVMLRIAGIYGPHRLPIGAAQAQTPLIDKTSAPCINYIYVNDLITIAYQLASMQTPHCLYNVADGAPQLMGALQQQVAQILELQPAPYESWEQAWQKASIMKQEFMKSSKRLSIERLRATLKNDIFVNELKDAVQQSLHINKL